MAKRKLNNQTMDKYLKKTCSNNEMDNEPGTSSQSPHWHPGSKEEAAHATHSFEYLFRNKKDSKYQVSCKEVGTIEKSLQTSKKFTDNIKMNKDKEIVILRDRRAISAHFPCCLIEKGELLQIEYIKAAKNTKHPISCPHSRMPSEKPVTFHVATKGGKLIVNEIMKNAALKKYDEVSVYAYKGETVRQSLRRDGRFKKTIFTKDCALSDQSTEVNTEMSNLVDDLDGKSFKIILLGGSIHLDSQPSSLEDTEVLPNESQGSPPYLKPDSPQQSTTNVPLKTHMPEQKRILNGSITLAKAPLREIPDSGYLLNLLRSQFSDLLKHMKNREKISKLSQVQSLFTQEYGKNVQTCMEVKMVKKLIALGESVCQVRIKGSAHGSGFLLFDKFILTNGHVVQDIYDQESRELQETVTVTFCFEDLDMRHQCIMPVKKEVVAFAHHKDASGSLHDFALLELCTDPALTLPSGLLSTFGFPSPKGGICIIGHPEGGVKKIDPCFIIPFDERSKTIGKHLKENEDYMHLINDTYFKNSDRQRITYDSCFYHGSSGSPVFDEHCNLIAMHCGGYDYVNSKGQKQRLIEYAVPMSLVLEKILVQVALRKRMDVLNDLLKHRSPKWDRVMESVIQIIDREGFNVSSEITETNDQIGLTSSDSQEPMEY